jgi:hypothetical protein
MGRHPKTFTDADMPKNLQAEFAVLQEATLTLIKFVGSLGANETIAVHQSH